MLRETQFYQDKEELKKRRRNFILLLILCIICVIITVIIQIVEMSKPKDIRKTEDDKKEIVEFNQLFNNKINSQNYKIEESYLEDEDKELVYTIYEKNEKVESKHDISINIPTINIEDNQIKDINKEIIDTFKAKADSIVKSKNEENVIYTVEYSSYVNSDILSIVIRSTLKEGKNAQRVIVKGYTYNISTKEIVKLDDIISLKELNTSKLKNSIESGIKASIEQNKPLIDLGYSVYERNLNDDIYKIENIDNFFYGPDGVLYIIFAYGNTRYTSELDIITIK